MPNLKLATNRLFRLLATKQTFYVIMVIFVLESLWVAISSRYPMAFDEQQHFGLIQLHAKQWSPFLHDGGAKTAAFGAVSRDPSFLYHYLMSFPYRVIKLFTDSQMVQVLILRLLDIGLMFGGLLIFRRLLARLGAGRLRQNVTLLLFIWLPIFPLMAGQISYDNLIFVLAAAVLYMGVRFLQEHRSTGRIDAGLLAWLLVICLLASTVKYAFLPVFAAAVLCLLVVVGRNPRQTIQAFANWWGDIALLQKGTLIGLFIAGAALFGGSYGINLVRYHDPVPACDKVLSIQTCTAYAPWNRDYQSSLLHPHVGLIDMPHYTVGWISQMVRETFFEVGSTYQDAVVVYFTQPPLPLIHAAGWVLLVIGALAVVADWRAIWRNPAYRLIFIVLGLYTIALFATNVQGYLRSGNPVAIHGRYLIPIMLPVIVIAGDSTVRLIRRILQRRPTWQSRWQTWRGVFLVALCLCWLQGGLVSFLMAANSDWLWANNQPIAQINHTAQTIVRPFVVR